MPFDNGPGHDADIELHSELLVLAQILFVLCATSLKGRIFRNPAREIVFREYRELGSLLRGSFKEGCCSIEVIFKRERLAVVVSRRRGLVQV